MIALLTNKVTGYVVGAVLIVLAGWWIHATIYERGYEAASAKYEMRLATEATARAVASENEQRRQTIANNAAKKREAEAIAALESEEANNLELRRRLASEAQQDPDAGKPVLGSDSVRRINQIR